MDYLNTSLIINEVNDSKFITYLYNINCDTNIIYNNILNFLLNNNKFNNIKTITLIKDNHFNIIKKMIFHLENKGFIKDAAKGKINYLYKLFKLSIDKDKLNELELIKLSLIESLIDNPNLIIIKNIFNNLAYKDRINILKILNNYCLNYHITIILLTNNTNDLLFSDYTYVISDYKILFEGKSINVLKEDLLLNKLNFELPLVIDLSLKLNFYGLLDEPLYDIESLVNKLWN